MRGPPNEPIILSWLFRGPFALYAVIMLFFVFRSATVDNPLNFNLNDLYNTFMTYLFSLIIVLLLLSFLLWLNQRIWAKIQLDDNSSNWNRVGPWVRNASISLILVAYSVPYFIFVPRPFAPVHSEATLNPLPIVVVIQGAILTVIAGVSSAPLLPPELPTRIEKRAEYLKLDMRQWWRWGQLAMSFFFAFGVGIAATAYLESPPSDITIHVITSLGGIFYLAWYALKKISAINEEILDCYQY